VPGMSNMPGMPGKPMFDAMEEQARKNMAMFTQALSMFPGFGAAGAAGTASEAAQTQAREGSAKETSAAPAPAGDPSLEMMRQQLEAMQKKLEELSKKG